MAEPKRNNRWLVAGLGNHGKEYEGTRHNVGTMVAAELARRVEGVWQRKLGGALCPSTLAGRQTWILQPRTYMNASGQAVAAVARYFAIPVEHVVAVHDDVDLALGRLKLKFGGGDGGHKGVRSIIDAMGSADFARVRIGIGRDLEADTADYVLDRFTGAERKIVDGAVSQAADAVEVLLGDGMTAAMNRFNSRAP